MTTVELERTSVVASNDNRTTSAIDFPEAFGDKRTLKRAPSALQRGPICFHRDNVIACEGDVRRLIARKPNVAERQSLGSQNLCVRPSPL